MKLTNGKGVDATIIAGSNEDILAVAVKITKPGGNISNVNYFGSCEVLSIPRLEWGCGMAHKTIRGVLCPGGRLRVEKLASLVVYKRVDPSKLVTHVFHGFENIEKALMLMKDNPQDLIKPVVLID